VPLGERANAFAQLSDASNEIVSVVRTCLTKDDDPRRVVSGEHGDLGEPLSDQDERHGPVSALADKPEEPIGRRPGRFDDRPELVELAAQAADPVSGAAEAVDLVDELRVAPGGRANRQAQDALVKPTLAGMGGKVLLQSLELLDGDPAGAELLLVSHRIPGEKPPHICRASSSSMALPHAAVTDDDLEVGRRGLPDPGLIAERVRSAHART
jgi:hypothetical protein